MLRIIFKELQLLLEHWIFSLKTIFLKLPQMKRCYLLVNEYTLRKKRFFGVLYITLGFYTQLQRTLYAKKVLYKEK